MADQPLLPFLVDGQLSISDLQACYRLFLSDADKADPVGEHYCTPDFLEWLKLQVRMAGLERRPQIRPAGSPGMLKAAG